MSLRVQYFGQPYPDTPRYYWVDVRFPCCAGPILGPAAINTAEFLDSNNVVLCQWDPEPGATNYIVLQTDEPTMPASGTHCVVGQTGANSFTDSGQTLSVYPEAIKFERPKAGQAFEVTIAKPSPRPDRRMNDPENVKAKEAEKAFKESLKDKESEKKPAHLHK